MKISFETKILIIFVAVLTFGLSMINVVSFLFYKLSLQQTLEEKAQIVYILHKKDKTFQVPEYYLISNKPIFDDNYQPVYYNSINSEYVYLSKSYIQSRLKDFAFLLITWDFILILSLMLIIYFVIGRYLKKEAQIKKYLEMILLSISHKLGNFLSVQRINLEIVEKRCEIPAVGRLKNAFSSIEKDFKFTVNILKNLNQQEKKVKNLAIDKIIKEILNSFSILVKEKKLKTRLKSLTVKADTESLKNIIYILVENAVFHSKEKIYIKICETKKSVFLIIKNDINPDVKKGSGIGLEIAKFLAEKESFTLITRAKKDFLTILKIRR